jgi:hypothetical protein
MYVLGNSLTAKSTPQRTQLNTFLIAYSMAASQKTIQQSSAWLFVVDVTAVRTEYHLQAHPWPVVPPHLRGSAASPTWNLPAQTPRRLNRGALFYILPRGPNHPPPSPNHILCFFPLDFFYWLVSSLSHLSRPSFHFTTCSTGSLPSAMVSANPRSIKQC